MLAIMCGSRPNAPHPQGSEDQTRETARRGDREHTGGPLLHHRRNTLHPKRRVAFESDAVYGRTRQFLHDSIRVRV